MFDTPGKWTNAKKKLLAAGFTVRQNGDTEGTALFNPEDKSQARFAFKITGAVFVAMMAKDLQECWFLFLSLARLPVPPLPHTG
jgi:hypothetical protein